MKILPKLLVFFAVIQLLSSCASRRDVIYFQNVDQIAGQELNVKYSTIKPYDKLSILVTAEDPEVVKAFVVNQPSQSGGGNNTKMYYTVSESGEISLPYIGKIKAEGKTRLQLIDHITKELERYIKDPIVNVTLENFQVTVLGATGSSVIEFEHNDRPTILEAFARSGDLNITAKRNDILIIREEAGKRNVYKVDIRDANIVNSPAYYLAQNDIIYVEQNTTGIQGNRSTWYLSLGMTIITVALTVINLVK